ncbi:MAG: hypothetical protein QNJ78_03545 [Gammaproteobacteria bacterium]|nr:hypothetical protein [Gammaproteobacteria bacterium]
MGYSPYVQPFSSSDNYRFRPYRDVNRDRNEYESAYPPIQERGHPMTAGEPAYPGLPGYGAYQYPKNTYRFRPLDKQRNERRWHGNYGQTLIDQAPSPNPYHRQSYPIYTPQSGPEPDPLWANSWPDQ